MKKDTIKKIGAGFFALSLAVSPLLGVFSSSNKSFADGEAGKYTIKLTSQTEGAGAKFKIVEKELINSDGSSTESNKDLGTVTIGESNEALYKVDKKGVYTVKQIKRAPGYLLNEKEAQVEFPVMKDGVESTEQVSEISVKQNLVQANLHFMKYGQRVVKDDFVEKEMPGIQGVANTNLIKKEEGQSKQTVLEGVQFKLTRTHAPETIADNNSVATWKEVTEEGVVATSDSEGNVDFNNLKEGKYTLTETATIDGYDVLKNERKFVVTLDSNLKPVVKAVVPNSETEYPLYYSEGGKYFYSFIENYKTPILNKKIIDPVTSEKVTEINTNVLVDYKYVLRVELPSNWDKNKTFKIEDILNENLHQPKVEKVEYKSLKMFRDMPNPVGAEHEITSPNTVTRAYTYNVKTDTVTVEGNTLSMDLIKAIKDEDGYISPAALNLDAEGLPAFIEITLSTKVKAETVLNRIPNNFTIEYDNPNGEGTKKITSNDVFTNITKGSVEFIKTESDGVTPLKGAEFKLYKLDENGTVEIDGQKYSEAIDPKTNQAYPTYITGEDGKVSQTDLPFATYAFKEVKAPEGYRLMNDAIKFTIDKDNTNIKLDNVKNYRIGEIVINTGTVGVALATIAGIGTMATGFILNKRKKEDK